MVIWVGSVNALLTKANSVEIAMFVRSASDTNAILLANHGVLVCGRNTEAALKTAELVEKMAWLYKGASDLGKAYEVSKEAFDSFKAKFDSDFSTV